MAGIILPFMSDLGYTRGAIKPSQDFIINGQDGLNFYREFSSWAHYTSVDTQGRILIPQILQEESNIRNEILILGVVDWIEVWDPKKYSEFKEKSKTDYDSGARMFFGSLIRGRRAKNANSETSECSDE